MKVALVHDWLTGMRGGEKVLDAICELYPDADLFTLVYVPGSLNERIESRRIVTSPLQNIPGIQKRYRQFLPLMPWAVEQLDVRGYDLVISSSHCVAKSVRPSPGAVHLCYSHTPMRYVWDQFNDYFGPGRASLLVRAAMAAAAPWLRRWDARTSARVTAFAANSHNVEDRIRRFYGRPSRVIYPPVDVERFLAAAPRSGDYYLMVTAFAPYKRVDIAVSAFNTLNLPLVIVGKGQDESRLRALAGPSTRFMGWLQDAAVADLYLGCKALVFPGEEDFGIVPVEAMACGKPVIALGRGGALETVKDGISGVFFEPQTESALKDAVRRFEKMRFDADAIRRTTASFSRSRFLSEIKAFVGEHVAKARPPLS